MRSDEHDEQRQGQEQGRNRNVPLGHLLERKQRRANPPEEKNTNEVKRQKTQWREKERKRERRKGEREKTEKR